MGDIVFVLKGFVLTQSCNNRYVILPATFTGLLEDIENKSNL